MKRFVLFFFVLAAWALLGPAATAQTRPTKVKVFFEVDSMPQQLLVFLNGNSKAEEKLAANAQVVEQFKGAYASLDSKRKQQVVDMYNAARKTKLEPTPDYVNLTQAMVAYAGAKVSASTFDEWVAAVSAIFTITNKKKEMQEFIGYTAMLVEDRTLFKSRT